MSYQYLLLAYIRKLSEKSEPISKISAYSRCIPFLCKTRYSARMHVVHGVPKLNIYTHTVDVTGTVVTCPPGNVINLFVPGNLIILLSR
jgi:hypothetical protein